MIIMNLITAITTVVITDTIVIVPRILMFC